MTCFESVTYCHRFTCEVNNRSETLNEDNNEI